MVDYIRTLTRLRAELEPLRRGALANLYVSEQQYAYARTTKKETVLVVINNDKKAAEIEFEALPVGLKNGSALVDRLGVSKGTLVANGKVKIKMPERSAAILVRAVPASH